MLVCLFYVLCMLLLVGTSLLLIVSGDDVDAVLHIALYGYVMPEIVEVISRQPDQHDGENGD
jgi:hypothetical protein